MMLGSDAALRGGVAGGTVRKTAVASFFGTALEANDFLLYGSAAGLVFGKLLFPSADPLAGSLLALATYSVGFVARPIGGILIKGPHR